MGLDELRAARAALHAALSAGLARNAALLDAAADALRGPACVVCQEARGAVVMVPCGHMCLCQVDAGQMRERAARASRELACPLCKRAVERMQPVFLP